MCPVRVRPARPVGKWRRRACRHPNRAKDRRLRVIAKYDFQPNEPEELAFRKGDVITVLEQVRRASPHSYSCSCSYSPTRAVLYYSSHPQFIYSPTHAMRSVQDDENWWKGELRGASGLFPVRTSCFCFLPSASHLLLPLQCRSRRSARLSSTGLPTSCVPPHPTPPRPVCPVPFLPSRPRTARNVL